MNKVSPHVVIVHGTMGSPDGNWFPWLQTQLINHGASVSIPRFPTPGGQNLKNWLAILSEEVRELQSNHVLIGHSIGAAFVLRVLERVTTPVRAAFLVAGFAKQLGSAEFDRYNQTFLEGAFEWGSIRKNAGVIKIYNSDNDPYVPLWLGENLAGKLGVDLDVIKGGGHLNADSGFLKFEKLLLDLKQII